MIDTNGYADAPKSTGTPKTANTTLASEIQSLELYDNSEIQVISVARARTPFLHTLINLGRGLSGWDYSALGINEKLSKNFPEYKFWEQDEENNEYTSSATISDSGTTLTFITTAGLYNGLVLRNAVTNENFRITSITNGTTAVIQRGVWTVPAATITTWDKLLVISSAAERGAANIGTRGKAKVEKTNYFQKFLTTMSTDDFDDLANKVKWGETLVMRKTVQHAIDFENAVLFWQKSASVDPISWKAFYTMEWVISYAKRGWSNDISSSLTKRTLEEALSDPLKYTMDGQSKKIVICWSKAKAAIADLFENRLHVNQIKDVDLTFDSLKINHWTFVFVDHPFLDEVSGFEGHIIVLDPSYVKVVYPTAENEITKEWYNGKTSFKINTANKTFAYTEATLVTYATLELANANSAGIFKIV